MKKYLISPEKKQYKANMHSHSTFSDGKLTVEQLKEAYMERGYSVFAFSDHRTIHDHRDLAEANFLPLSAAEIDVSQPGKENFNLRKSFHFNIIRRNPDSDFQLKYNNANFSFEYINELIAEAKANNCIVVANHPNWSLFTEDDYMKIEGLDGFELYNCITANYGGALSFTPEIYMYLLRNGHYVRPIGADDNHSFCLPFSEPYNDSFGGFTYIMADKLDYLSIIGAIDAGDCYCSMGPQFKEISVDGDELYVKTTDAVQISMLCDTRYTKFVNAPQGETVNELKATISRENVGKFILFYTVDKNGLHAMTRAYITGKDF